MQRAMSLREQLDDYQKWAEVDLEALDGTREPEVAAEADTALGEESCPVCGHAAAAVLFAFLSKYQYTISASEATQASHAKIGDSAAYTPGCIQR